MMNNVHSLCTVADESNWDDLQLLLLSISIYNPFVPVYIYATKKIIELLNDSELSDGRIKIKLMEYCDDKTINVDELTIDIIEIALSYNANTFFISPNTLIIKHLDIRECVDNNCDIGNTSVVNSPNSDAIVLKDTYVEWLRTQNKDNKFNKSTSFTKGSYLECGIWKRNKFENEKNTVIIKTYFGNKYKKDYFMSRYNRFIIDNFFNGDDKLSNVIRTTTKLQPQFNTTTTTTTNKINLLVQYLNVNDTHRQKEYDFCFHANLDNPHIEMIYNFVSESTLVPENIRNHPKYMEVMNIGDLKFSEAFEFANNELKNKTICVVRSDIFLDHTSDWKVANDVSKQNIVLCLSRFEFDGKEAKKDLELNKFKFCNKQDGWVFKSPINIEIDSCQFAVNETHSDVSISYCLKKSNYILLNNQNEFKLYRYNTKNMELTQKGILTNYYLLPDIDSFVISNGGKVDVSIDDAAKYLGLVTLQKYEIICDMFSKHVKLQ